MPIDFAVKERIRSKAKKILSQSGVTVIGITGSYGKTSAKSFLSAILKEKFDVIETPGNINTDIGIAEFVIKNANLFKKGSVFIVEMGAHRRGDIKKICDIAQPDYSILTGINETHLERFGSLGNIIQGKFELPLHTKKFTVINFDDANVQVGLSQYQLSCECIEVSQKDVESFEYKENFSGIWFVWKGSVFESKMLARHNATLIILCATLAERLGVSHEDMIQGISKLAPVKHRIEPIFNHQTGVTVLDDSYNGNFDGVKSAVEVLSQAKGRKIVLTPGLVELGNQSDTIHHQIGELYAKNVDLVLLIKTPMVKAIINGMKMKSFSLYTVYSTAQKAHEELSHVLKRGDTILFQNDVTDNYL